jgi:hypothetical protein
VTAGSSDPDQTGRVPEAGLEPARGFPQWILSPSRLPISTLRRPLSLGRAGCEPATFEVVKRVEGMAFKIEGKVFEINDRLAGLAAEQAAVEAELSALRLIDDDAQRDAALGYDRLEATSTRADVRRFERVLQEIDRRRAELLDRRHRLLDRLITPTE